MIRLTGVWPKFMANWFVVLVEVNPKNSSSRGFHAFANYRTRILFYCGKLDMKPNPVSH
jgi:hypothetical protein